MGKNSIPYLIRLLFGIFFFFRQDLWALCHIYENVRGNNNEEVPALAAASQDQEPSDSIGNRSRSQCPDLIICFVWISIEFEEICLLLDAS